MKRGKRHPLGSIKENHQVLLEKIDAALRRSGRQGERVDLVAVTKNTGIPRIEEAIAAGLDCFGENRVQEAREKIPHFADRAIAWHMVGHLQRNKVKVALSLFSMIQSLDSLDLAREVSRRGGSIGGSAEFLIQVNSSGEESKHGIGPSELEDFLGAVDTMPNIRIRGLMTIAPFTDEALRVREAFRALFRLFEKARKLPLVNSEMRFLSMGMTGDYEIAIEEGSNLIRIGTALFGQRR